MTSSYIGRFAPSPTGELHLGSLACALASYIDARACGGKWLLRIENIDPPREVPNAINSQLHLLRLLEMEPDEPVLYQSDRDEAYKEALDFLIQKGFAYGCACSRKEIQEAGRRRGLPSGVYPGTCRNGTHGRPVRAWRLRVPDEEIGFTDAWESEPFSQNLEKEVGDFVLKRADGFWAYQLAAIVDDGFQHVTHIVRGRDLLDNTPRQIYLRRCLGLPDVHYRHIPLVLGPNGQKLSKQNMARPVDASRIDEEVLKAWEHLGFSAFGFEGFSDFYAKAVPAWKKRFYG